MSSPEGFLIHYIPQDELFSFFVKNKEQFQSAGGIVLFLYSLVLTRGVAQVAGDMRVGTFGNEFLFLTSTHTQQIPALLSLASGAYAVRRW
jgi:hypothetical protein